MREHLHPAIASTRTTTRTSALSITYQIRRDRVHPSTSITTQSPRARGRPRAAYEAIIWRIDNGAKWRSIPAELGDWHRAYLRFRGWAVSGVWDKIIAQSGRAGGNRSWNWLAWT